MFYTSIPHFILLSFRSVPFCKIYPTLLTFLLPFYSHLRVYHPFEASITAFCVPLITNLLYCLKLWPRRLFLSSNFSPRPLNETGNYTRPAFISLSSESKLFRLWIIMEAGNTCAAYLLDTVHHKMDSAVCCSQCFYKSVLLRVLNKSS